MNAIETSCTLKFGINWNGRFRKFATKRESVTNLLIQVNNKFSCFTPLLMQYHRDLPTTSVRNVWAQEKRICSLILGIKVLKASSLKLPINWN